MGLPTLYPYNTHLPIPHKATLKQLPCNPVYRVRLTHGVKMKGGNTKFDQLLRLLDAPFNAYFLDLRVVLALLYLIGEFFGNVDMEYLWQNRALSFAGYRFNTRNNGNINADLPAFLNKFKILLIVKEHLGDNVFCPQINFQLQVFQVVRQV